MKSIRVFVSASDDLGEVRLVVMDLLVQLNRFFRPRGIEFVPALPSECPAGADIAVALYWKDFGPLSRPDFERAYESFKETRLPKIYVFFKDPDAGITGALKAFKESFDDRYGHFFCRFEAIDSVKFELSVKSLLLLPRRDNHDELKIEAGNIALGGESVASLDNLPFAKMNAKRQSLKRQIAAAAGEVAALEADAVESPEDADVAESLREARKRRHDLKEELKHYDGFLLGAAVFFAKSSAEEMDERVRKARELFEQGKVQAANQVLDLDELCASADRNLAAFEAQREGCEKDIQALLAKAEMVLTDDSMPLGNRYETAFEAYQKAIQIARTIRINPEHFVNLLVNSSWNCRNLGKFKEAETLLNEALAFLRGEKGMESRARVRLLASVLFALSFYYDDQDQLFKAIATANELIRMLDNQKNGLPAETGDIYAAAQHNLGVYWRRCGKTALAEAPLRKAIQIRRSLVEAGDSTPVVESLLELGGVLNDLDRIPEAEWCFKEAQTELFGKNAPEHDSATRLRAGLLSCWAIVHARQNQFERAESDWTESVTIKRDFLERNPGIQLEKLPADLVDLGVLYLQHGQPEKATLQYDEAESFLGEMARTSSANYERARLNMHYAFALSDLGHEDEAKKRIQEAVRLSQGLIRSFPEIDQYWRLATGATYHQGTMLSASKKRKDMERAERILQEATRMAQKNGDKDSFIQGIGLSAMVERADILLKLGKRSESERLAKQCCDSLERMSGDNLVRLSLHPASVKRLHDVLSRFWCSTHPAWIESAMRKLEERKSYVAESQIGIDRTIGG